MLRSRCVRTLVGGVLTAVLAVGLTGCSQTLGGAEGFVGGTGTVSLIEPEDRNPVPHIAGRTLDGRLVTLADLAGSTVVVNVWGSWCVPCRTEAPELVSAASKLAGDDVRFLGINVRDEGNVARARSFVDNYDIPYPSLYDPDSSTLLGFEPRPVAIPSTMVIDGKGRVAALVLGEVTDSTLVGLVEDVQDGA